MPTHVPALLKTRCQMSKWPGQQAREHMCMHAYICRVHQQHLWKCCDPQPWMVPDNVCGREEDFTLKSVESARGTVQLHVCVCVCHRVITSWTKLGFQGCWCQLALLWSTARPLFRFLTFPLWATSPLLHISHTGGTRRLWPHTHTYITSPTRECVCKRARERSEYSESPAPKHSKQLSYDQWVRHYLWFIWVAPQTILTHSPYSVRLTLFLAYSERSNSDKTALGNIVVILLLLNLRRGKTPSLHRGLLHFRRTCDVQLVAVTPPRTITAGGLQLYCITLLTAS